MGVIAFDNEIEYPIDRCYQQGIALATSANKLKLSDFAVRIQASSQSPANYSNAFSEAFRLLAASGNINDSSTDDSRRGT